MQENVRLHKKAYHHVKRHIRKYKKRYLRFISFFIFLVAFGVIEDLTAVTLTGVEFNLIVLITVIVVASIFTIIAEVTETFVEEEEPTIKKMIRKEEIFVEKEENIIKKKIKKLS